MNNYGNVIYAQVIDNDLVIFINENCKNVSMSEELLVDTDIFSLSGDDISFVGMVDFSYELDDLRGVYHLTIRDESWLDSSFCLINHYDNKYTNSNQ